MTGRRRDRPGTVLFRNRDVTDVAKGFGIPDDGVLALPIYGGWTLPGPITAPLITSPGFRRLSAMFPAGPTGTVTQRIYATRTTGTTLYLAAEGANGFAATGIVLGNATYPDVADADLVEVEPFDDESATNGNLSGLGTPGSIAAAVVAGASGFTDGDHALALVNFGPSDIDEPQLIILDVGIKNVVAGDIEWLPAAGWEELLVTEASA
jgi:hypothetical protein